jgi:hypothetical protein
MHQFGLYLWLKAVLQELNPALTITFNDMDSNGNNSVGIYVKGDAPEVRTLGNMSYTNSVARVQLLQVCALNNTSLMQAQSVLSEFQDQVCSTASEAFELDTSKIGVGPTGKVVYADGSSTLSPAYLTIIEADAISDLLFIGKTEQGKPQISLNLRIIYSVQGGN